VREQFLEGLVVVLGGLEEGQDGHLRDEG